MVQGVELSKCFQARCLVVLELPEQQDTRHGKSLVASKPFHCCAVEFEPRLSRIYLLGE